MIFTVKTSGTFYKNEKYRKLLEELGFEFSEEEDDGEKTYRISDSIKVEVEDLEDIITIARTYGQIIITIDNEETSIEIYDVAREVPNLAIFDK